MVETFSDLIPYYSWLYIPIALLALFTILKYRKSSNLFSSNREKIISLIFGILFVSLYISGLVIASGGGYNEKSMGFMLVSCCLFSAAIGIGYHFINLFLAKQFETAPYESQSLLLRHPLTFPFATMLLCWMPVFFALYPGLFAYDVGSQIPQTFGSYSKHHPLLHTFFLKAFYKLGEKIGSYNTGMALSVLVQMAMLALSLAYSIRYLIRIRVKKTTVIAVLIFFSTIPIFPILAVSMTKDILFSAAFLASLIKILELRDGGFKDLGIRNWMLIFVLFTLTALLRNNGKYAVFAVVAVFFIEALITKSNRKQTYVLAVTTIMLISVSDAVLTDVTQASEIRKNEMMSVPYQQLARAYKYNPASFSSEDASSLKNLIPNIGNYNQYLSDPIKLTATVFNSSENQKLFCRIYFKYMLRILDRYAEAFLANTMGYWYLDDISAAPQPWGLFAMYTTSGFGVTHESKFNWLDRTLKMLFNENKYQELPVISVLFNMGMYFWLLLTSIFYCIQQKKKTVTVPLVFIIVYTATIFAGPCAYFRYAFPVIVCIPFFMAVAYNEPKNTHL